MAASDVAIRAARARRAYEWGRLGHAARRAAWLVPLATAALAGCDAPAIAIACGAGLILLVTACLWRGQDFTAGVWPGIIAGALPLLLPAALRLGHATCTGGGRCIVVPICCAIGGAAAGVLLGLLAPLPRPGRPVPFVVACSVAAIAGAAGCVVYGLVGLAVMAAGMLAGALPTIAFARPRASH